MTTQPSDMKPSDRIRELAEAGESHPFLIGSDSKIEAIISYLDERHAAGQGEPDDGSSWCQCPGCGATYPIASVCSNCPAPVAAGPELSPCAGCGELFQPNDGIAKANRERDAALALVEQITKERDAIASDERAAVLKAKVYGEKAYKWRKRCIDGGIAHDDDRIIADEWLAREEALTAANERAARLEAELAQLRDVEDALIFLDAHTVNYCDAEGFLEECRALGWKPGAGAAINEQGR